MQTKPTKLQFFFTGLWIKIYLIVMGSIAFEIFYQMVYKTPSNQIQWAWVIFAELIIFVLPMIALIVDNNRTYKRLYDN